MFSRPHRQRIAKLLQASLGVVQDRAYLRLCLHRMHMDERLLDRIPAVFDGLC